MDMINFDGLLIGIATFLIIGLFHPVVVKAEYYWGRNGCFLTDRECFCLCYLWSFRFLFVLDDQRSIRTGRARIERLVSEKSEKTISGKIIVSLWL